MVPDWTTAKIVDIQDEAPLVNKFFLELDGISSFEFIPGQFITLDLPIDNKPARRWRHYSIASYPNGSNIVELVIVLVEGGKGTNFLFNEACLGTTFPVRGPLGKFVLPTKPDREICFVCTGTGIAPFRSMLLDFFYNQKKHPPINLIFGTREKSNILYYEEMKALAEKMEHFNYIPTLSQPDEGWKGHKGYVHPVYEEIYKDKRPADFYLCGWKNMITEARQRISEMGYAKENIHVEIYG